MGVNVYLETEQGERLMGVTDPHKLLNRALEDARGQLSLLRYVDVYGETIFNGLQAPNVLADIDVLRGGGANDAVLDHLARIEEMVREMTRQRHLHVRFSGD